MTGLAGYTACTIPKERMRIARIKHRQKDKDTSAKIKATPQSEVAQMLRIHRVEEIENLIEKNREEAAHDRRVAERMRAIQDAIGARSATAAPHVSLSYPRVATRRGSTEDLRGRRCERRSNPKSDTYRGDEGIARTNLMQYGDNICGI